MIYGNYLRDKYNNTAVKLADAEGVPCIMEYSKGNNMRNYEIHGNSVQDGTPTPDNPVEVESVGALTTKNLFDMNKLIEQGWVQQVDGSYYVEKSSTPRRQVLWENAENYTGQLKILFKVKYSLDSEKGCYLRVNYTDGTYLIVSYAGTSVADTWYSPTVSRTITDASKIVQNIIWTYAMGNVSTWVKDIIITKDIAATEYEPYHKYKIPVVTKGKNLLPYPYVGFKDEKTITLNGITFTDNGDGSISVNGTATVHTGFYLANNSNLTIKPNTTYTLSGFDELNVSQADLRVSDNLTTAYMVHRENTSAVFQYSNTDKVYIQILIRNGTVCDNLKFKPQLELGSTATEYEPYIPPVTTNIYLDEPLRGIGNYRDYIDLKNGRVVRQIGVMTLDGDESALYTFTPTRPQEGYSCYRYLFSVAQGTHACLCNKIPYKEYGYSVATSGTCISFDSSRKNLIFKIPTEWASTVNEFKAWLAANPCTVYYVIYPRIEENISLPVLKTFKGTTIMLVDTSIQPSNIKTKYVRS